MSNLLQVQGGQKSFGARLLFRDASFAINAGEHVGVIGPNGAGKSTLFKVLVGSESLDVGQITRMSGLRLGYLAQEDKWDKDVTVEQYLSGLLTPIWDLKQLARGMGLSESDFSRPIMSFSGGYRMRVKLLHLLGSQPDLMLLDEPTNYLDLETLIVLEDFLLGFKGAFLLISHDREFLRRTTDHILEVEDGDVTKYPGNIDDYFEQKALLREQLEKKALSQAAKRKEILDFAAKFGAKATKARQVQSRMKRLEKMEVIETKSVYTGSRIRLPEPVQTGRVVAKVTDGILGYKTETGDKPILRGVNFELKRGEHLGVVGVNGAGKSTLLKSLAGDLELLSGSRELGLRVEVGYFAQHVAEKLRPEATVIEELERVAAREIGRQEILDLAGSLLFAGDDVHKKVRVLSGGEKSRVALGQVLLKKAAFLLLDEPTNHLDFNTVEALTEALRTYEGTVVIISHDRSFMSRVATQILEIKNGVADFYPGTYDEYVWSTQKGVMAEQNKTVAVESGFTPVAGGLSDPLTIPKFNFKEQKKTLEKELRQVEKDITRAERETEEFRSQLVVLSEKISSLSGAEAVTCARELADLQAKLDNAETLWMTQMERREQIVEEIAELVEG